MVEKSVSEPFPVAKTAFFLYRVFVLLMEAPKTTGEKVFTVAVFEPDVSRRVVISEAIRSALPKTKIVHVPVIQGGLKLLETDPDSLFVLGETHRICYVKRGSPSKRLIGYEGVFSPADLLMGIREAIETMGTEAGRLTRIAKLNQLIGKSDAINKLRDKIQELSQLDMNILLTGETGTGKTKCAELLHVCGVRSQKAFRRINCPGIPETLFVSELFGANKGAFSGSMRDRAGRIESATGGTILFDEISEITVETQGTLLEFLDQRKITRLGDNDERHVDVRVVAATNKNLKKAIKTGCFREDLFYRLNQVSIHLPPLRERKGDIILLAEHFLREFGRARNRAYEFGSQTLKLLARQSFPGNIRQLRDAIQMATLNCNGSENILKPLHFTSL